MISNAPCNFADRHGSGGQQLAGLIQPCFDQIVLRRHVQICTKQSAKVASTDITESRYFIQRADVWILTLNVPNGLRKIEIVAAIALRGFFYGDSTVLGKCIKKKMQMAENICF